VGGELDIAEIPETQDDAVVAAGEQKPATSPGFLSGIASLAQGVAGVAKGTFDFFLGDKSAMAADPEMQEAVKKATEPIPNQDIIYEQLAHNLAYGKYDVQQLAAWGYGPPKVVIPLNPVTGMFAVAVEPDPELDPAELTELHGGLAPRAVIAFRGSTDAVDWADDLSTQGIGAAHFAAHKVEIAAALAQFAKDGAPDVTGHSLGGALAQLAATVGPVNRVVTFQAPGISPELAAQVPEEVQATHHRAAGDPVAWAGGTHLPGEEYIYNQAVWEDSNPHTSFLLDGLNALRGDAVPMIYDGAFAYSDYEMEEGVWNNRLDPEKVLEYEALHPGNDLAWVSHGAQDMNRDGQLDAFESTVDSGRAALSEASRAVVGGALQAADKVTGANVTAAVANFLNSKTSQGEAMAISGDDLRLVPAIWERIEPRIGLVDTEDLLLEIEGSGLRSVELIDLLRQQVIEAAKQQQAAGPTPHEGYE
jgi:hypothetical protein